ncbi:MAG: response regulator, partial [Anaerolineae bacterium]|nr:response regulator [Anaerolineae bacterium]
VLEAGAIEYLIKPVTRADLREALQTVDKPVKRVLVVDDDPDFQQLVSRMLLAWDSTLETVLASSGEQALEELHRGSFDVMLLDVMMPDMSGWEVLEQKEQDEAIRDVPVILVSAHDPADEPINSDVLLIAMRDGLSPEKLLRCSLQLSALLLAPSQEPDPTLV